MVLTLLVRRSGGNPTKSSRQIGIVVRMNSVRVRIPMFRLFYALFANDPARQGRVWRPVWMLLLALMVVTTSLELSAQAPQVVADEHPLLTQGYEALQTGQSDQALAAFQQVLQLDSQNTSALLGQAMVFAEKERHAQAFSVYDQIVRHQPGHAFAWNGRGLAAFNLEDFDEALTSFKQAILDQPVNGFYYESLAWTQMCRGEFADAAESAKTSMLMYNRNGEKAVYPLLIAYFCYLEGGDIENARRTLSYAQSNHDPNLWPAPIIGFLTGKIGQADLISFVMDSTEETEAHTYIGLKLRSENQLAAAGRHLEWVSQHGDQRVFEYTLARAIRFRNSVAVLGR